jgi:hypothetical protein
MPAKAKPVLSIQVSVNEHGQYEGSADINAVMDTTQMLSVLATATAGLGRLAYEVMQQVAEPAPVASLFAKEEFAKEEYTK